MELMTNGQGATQRLVRRTDDKVIAGVCSGLAAHFGWDPLVVRIAFLLLAGGGGLLVYLVAWALIPADGAAGPARPASSTLGSALLVGAAVVLTFALGGLIPDVFVPLGPWDGMRVQPWGMAAFLVVAGVLLLRGQVEPAGAGAAGDDEGRPEHVTVPARARALPRPPRERSGLVPLTLAVALLTGGTATILANAGWLALDVGQLAALGLLVVSAGLLVGSWFGRARWLIPVAILMTPFVLVASLVDFPPSGALGNDYRVLRRPGELQNMRVLAGQVTLDLSHYPFAEGTEEARLRVAVGSINVYVPRDVHVEVDAFVRGGEAYVLGGYRQGFEVSVQDSAGPENATKRLEIELVGGFGTVSIYRVEGADRPWRERRERRERREQAERDQRRLERREEARDKERARGERKR